MAGFLNEDQDTRPSLTADVRVARSTREAKVSHTRMTSSIVSIAYHGESLGSPILGSIKNGSKLRILGPSAASPAFSRETRRPTQAGASIPDVLIL